MPVGHGVILKSSTTGSAKEQLRSEILLHLRQMSAEEKQRESLSIQSLLSKELESETGVWVGYQSLINEPSLDWSTLAPQIQWAFPQTQGQQMHFRLRPTQFEKSKLGVQEPVDGEAVSLENIQGVVIPALAFDHQGYRLGRGAGYYDRNLSQFKNKKIGVCFERSLLDECPHEAHDITCDVVIANQSVYKIKSSEGVRQW